MSTSIGAGLQVAVRTGDNRDLVFNVSKASFWGDTCRELISADLGRWLLDRGFAPWPKGNPPKFALEPLGNARFRLLDRE